MKIKSLLVALFIAAVANAQPAAPASLTATTTATSVSTGATAAAANPSKVSPPTVIAPIQDIEVDPDTGEVTHKVVFLDPLAGATFKVNCKGDLVAITVTMKDGLLVAPANLDKAEWSAYYTNMVPDIKVSVKPSRHPVKIQLDAGVPTVWEVAASLKRGDQQIVVVKKVGDKDGEGTEIDANSFVILPPKGMPFRLAKLGERLLPVQTWTVNGKPTEVITVIVE